EAFVLRRLYRGSANPTGFIKAIMTGARASPGAGFGIERILRTPVRARPFPAALPRFHESVAALHGRLPATGGGGSAST
uniref:tRNA-synt_2 domain-containing protein n=1 Tax=Macrostomum lignano TaxID=282301 RepID=A0A1I8FA05_9PLAT